MRSHLKLERAKSVLERRLFLKAMGLGLAAPVALKLAHSATAAPAGAPKRFLVMYIPHGVPEEHFNPRMSGSDPTQFALDMTNESILGPLEPYKKWVNVYQGFNYNDLGGTHEGIVNILSGANTQDTTTPRITLEHVIAKGLGVQPLILGACSHTTYAIDNHGMLFWDGTTAVDPQKNPAAAFDKLFAGQASSTPSPMQNADDQLRSAMLDLTTAELTDLKTSVSSLTTESNKLQSHLDAIAALKSNGGSGGGSGKSSCTTKPTLPNVEKVRQASAGIVLDSSHSNDYFYQEANFRLLFQAQLELVTQALICNAAQVIGLMPMYATAEFDFSFVGGALGGCSGWGHHSGLSHTGAQQASSAMYNSPISIDNIKADTRAAFGRAQRWFFDQLTTNVISVLATTPDPAASDGSMVLDNTLIYVTSEIGESQNHWRVSELFYPQTPSYLPMVSIGGAGGGIVPGQVFTLPITADKAGPQTRPATDVYLTFAKAMGVTATFPGTTGTLAGVVA
jgi:hypothetical protein